MNSRLRLYFYAPECRRTAKPVHYRQANTLRRYHFAVDGLHSFLIKMPENIKQPVGNLSVVFNGTHIMGTAVAQHGYMFRKAQNA